MRKQSIYNLLAIASILIVVFPASVKASLISLIPLTPTTDLVAGDTVSFDIDLDFTDVGGTIGGGFNVEWNSAALDYNSFTQNPSFGDPYSVFTDVLLPLSSSDIPNGILGIGVGNFFGIGGNSDPALNVLGTLSFEVLSTLTLDTDIALTSGASDPGGAWVDLSFPGVIINPVYTGATLGIVSVPNPATLTLFAIGLVGLLGFTRRKKIN